MHRRSEKFRAGACKGRGEGMELRRGEPANRDCLQAKFSLVSLRLEDLTYIKMRAFGS